MHYTKVTTQDAKWWNLSKVFQNEKHICHIFLMKNIILHLLVSLTLLRNNITFDCLNNPLESCPGIIWCNICIPTIWAGSIQGVYWSNVQYRVAILATFAFQGITCPPLFPNCRNSIQAVCILVGWPNHIEVLDDFVDGSTAYRVWMEIQWSHDLDKQQWVVRMCDNNCDSVATSFWGVWISFCGGFIGFFKAWNSPLGADIIALSWGTNSVKSCNKGQKTCFWCSDAQHSTQDHQLYLKYTVGRSCHHEGGGLSKTSALSLLLVGCNNLCRWRVASFWML